MRKPIIAGNWKLHLSISEAVELATALKEDLWDVTDRELVVAPVFTALSSVAHLLRGSPIKVASQDLFWEDQGAFTGEVSGPMIKDAGASFTLAGHSERRQYFGETDEHVNRKAAAALRAKLIPIICVGETLEEREADQTLDVIRRQLSGALDGFTADEVGEMVLAYEPVWAIGTGRTATPSQANEVHAFIRNLISEKFGDIVSGRIRILYGGSVKPDNVDVLMAESHIDGALVGGASLKAESFVRIARFQGR
jgi:triosephosphate isomerase